METTRPSLQMRQSRRLRLAVARGGRPPRGAWGEKKRAALLPPRRRARSRDSLSKKPSKLRRRVWAVAIWFALRSASPILSTGPSRPSRYHALRTDGGSNRRRYMSSIPRPSRARSARRSSVSSDGCLGSVRAMRSSTAPRRAPQHPSRSCVIATDARRTGSSSGSTPPVRALGMRGES